MYYWIKNVHFQKGIHMVSELVQETLHTLNSRTLAAPVRSLMDMDFYKLTMLQMIYLKHRDVQADFELIVRDPKIPIAEFIDEGELRDSLDFATGLQYRQTDLYYLRGMDVYERNMFREELLQYLKDYQLPPYELEIKDGHIRLAFRGKWAETSPWETIALAIISELYYRGVMRQISPHELEVMYARASDKLMRKLETLSTHKEVRFADFSQRRRHSFLWQKYAVGLAKKVLGPQFVGTSNSYLAFHYDLQPIGTNAHELPMVLTALANSDEEKRAAQYHVLNEWQEIYGQGLRIILPDTYGSAQFYAGAPEWVADWTGQRQDSGGPIAEGELYMAWLEKMGRNPKGKLTTFSDGLDVSDMVTYARTFEGRMKSGFGWGTLFGNDFRDCLHGHPEMRPFSMVCKVTSANGRPCVKLSNNVNKATGPKDEVEHYKRIFGDVGRTSQAVIV